MSKDLYRQFIETLMDLESSKAHIKLIGDMFAKPYRVNEAVENWAIERGLDTATPKAQMLKLIEEVGELAGALARNDKREVIDALGDIQVVLIVMGLQLNLDLTECLSHAYEVIKNRKGEMVDGVWVKEEDIKEEDIKEEDIKDDDVDDVVDNVIETFELQVGDRVKIIGHPLGAFPEDEGSLKVDVITPFFIKVRGWWFHPKYVQRIK